MGDHLSRKTIVLWNKIPKNKGYCAHPQFSNFGFFLRRLTRNGGKNIGPNVHARISTVFGPVPVLRKAQMRVTKFLKVTNFVT